MFLPGRGPRVGAALGPVLAVIGIAAGVVGLVAEAMSGFTGEAHRYGTTFPAWFVWAAALVIGVIALVVRARRAPWYKAWSMVELVDRPDGIVLFAGRLGARHEGLTVRRGETVELAASRQLRSTYKYVVTAPSGSMTFEADGYIQKLTMQPLEEAAAKHGITVVAAGDAGRIVRTRGI